ncbi:MAG: RDD family protein [Candidatus Woesearchaeota archaeon]
MAKQKSMKINARVWKRIAAFFADFLLLNFFVFAPFSGVFLTLIGDSYKDYTFVSSTDIGGNLFLLALVVSLPIILYFVLMQYMIGQTVGMLLFNLRLVDSKGKEPGLLRCFGRNILFLPIFPLVLLWLADPLFLVFKGTRLSDYITGTSVIEEYLYSEYSNTA